MVRFNRNNNRRSEGRTEMYPAVCDKCGRDCQVPFRPSGDKPIFCSNCFEKEGGSSNRFESRDSNRRNFSESRNRGDKEMFSAVCDECGKECKVPFRPSSDKPIYCSRCFENKGNTHEKDYSSVRNDKQSEQLDIIITKLDKIISALECKCESVVKKKAVKKTKIVKKTKEE